VKKVSSLNKHLLAPIDYSTFWDELEPHPTSKKDKDKLKKKINYAWCLKRLVSKKKRRIENEHFDLDLSYITKRVIAMGYPSVGLEAIYRNSATDIAGYFSMYHKNQVKVILQTITNYYKLIQTYNNNLCNFNRFTIYV